MVTTKKTLNFLIFNIILMVVFISCGTESANTNTDSIDQTRITADAEAKAKADAEAKAKSDVKDIFEFTVT